MIDSKKSLKVAIVCIIQLINQPKLNRIKFQSNDRNTFKKAKQAINR